MDMRTPLRFIAILFISTAGLSSAIAQNPLPSTVEEQAANGQVPRQLSATDSAASSCFKLMEPTEYYFGEIKQSDTVRHTFVFKNTCNAAVEIGSARTSCGCTSVVLSERLVPPGGEARILAKFTPPRGSKGRVSKSVSVYLKGENTAHTLLRVSATVQCDIEIEPSYIQIENAIAGKRTFTRSTIKNVSDRDVLVETTGVSLTSYPDDAEDAGGKTLPLAGGTVTPERLSLKPGESGVLTISFIPAFAGQLNGSVGLKIDDNENVIFLFGIVGK